MGTFSWRNARLTQERYPVYVPSGRLVLNRYYSNPNGTPIFMVHGVGESPSIFSPDQENAGLAPFLADIGFDVYVAQLRCSPSIKTGSDNSNTSTSTVYGLHHLILEDLPAHLAAVAKIRPKEPQFWVGHGLGNALMLSCYKRLDILPAPVLGFVQFGAGRRCELSSLFKSLAYMGWQLSRVFRPLFERMLRRLGSGNESPSLLKEIKEWHSDPDWLDPTDGFNYRGHQGAECIPPSLYFSLSKTALWGGTEDARLWLKELGDHDAQLITLSKRFGNVCDYGFQSMLTKPEAIDDHFKQMVQWLMAKQNVLGDERQRA